MSISPELTGPNFAHHYGLLPSHHRTLAETLYWQDYTIYYSCHSFTQNSLTCVCQQRKCLPVGKAQHKYYFLLKPFPEIIVT